jgi:hypothetical protein
MALLQNGFRDYSSGVRIFGATVSNSAYPSVHYGTFYSTSLDRNLTAGEGFTSDLVGVPSGYTNQYAWVQPQKAGGIKSFRESEGVATGTLALAAGKNAAGTSDGVASTTAILQLVVSGQSAANGVATVSGNVNAALNGAGTINGTATASATIGAIASVLGTSNGVATTALQSYATGALSGSIAPAVTLEASNFSSYLLDEEDVETGLTMRKALRLIAAATAGKVSGASGSTVTIKNAVADTRERIVATVDANGNRIAISYDLED